MYHTTYHNGGFMGLASNLKRRGGTYSVRVRVPVDLIERIGKVEIVRALGTSDPNTAKRLCLTEVQRIHSLFDAYRGEKQLTSVEIEEECQAVFRTLAEDMQRTRLSGKVPPRMSEDDIDPYEDDLRERAKAFWEECQEADFRRVHEVAEQIVARLAVHCPAGTPTHRELCQALMIAHAEAYRVEAERRVGDRFATPELPFNPALIGAFEAKSPGPIKAPRPSRGAQGATLSTIAGKYIEAMTRANAWTAKTEYQIRSTVGMFQGFVGDPPLSGIERSHVASFKEVLQQLPASRGKSAASKKMSMEELVEAAKKEKLPTLSQSTLQRHLSALIGLFSWAKSEGHYTGENPASGFKFPKVRRARDERPAWTGKQLGALFGSPVWKGCQSQTHRSERGPHVLKDDKYFIPLLGAFAGLRLEEACQLQVADVRKEQGVDVLSISPGPGKQLKSKAAARIVPVHPALKSAGFLKYVAKMHGEGHTMLFPHLKRGGPDKRLGYKWTQWFTQYRREIGVYREGLDFHAFRHSFTTALQDAEVPEPIIDELTGHEGNGETRRYTKEFRVQKLREAVAKVRYPGLDARHLYKRA
jgi:integrase